MAITSIKLDDAKKEKIKPQNMDSSKFAFLCVLLHYTVGNVFSEHEVNGNIFFVKKMFFDCVDSSRKTKKCRKDAKGCSKMCPFVFSGGF